MKRKILLRFDDICPTMDFGRFHMAMELMDSVGVKPLIGVIPECKDPDLQIEPYHYDFWDFVKSLQSKGYIVAMHGLYHVFDTNCRGMVNEGFKSEFAGHTYEEQYRKIKKGKEILEEHGITTDIFFAPAHSYDKNTIKALADNGFRYMSDGKSSKSYTMYGVKCIPCRSSGVPKFKKNKYYTAVFHAHEWVREDKKDAYDRLIDIVKNHVNEVVDFSEYANQKNGYYPLQRLSEILFVTWRRYLYPLAVKVYLKIKK